jgi:hypothetical protein
VTPLEIWDLEIGGETLFEARDRPDFGDRLAAAVEAIRAGCTVTRSGFLLPPACRSIDAIFAGGGALDPRAIAALRSIGLPLHLAHPIAFPAEAGGLALLAELGEASGIVVDVGQSAIKLSHRLGRARFVRDLGRLPIAGPGVDPAAGREALRQFVGAAIIAGAAAIGDVRTVILALPAALDAEGRPGPSTYPGLEGDVDLARDAIARAGVAGARAWILNDAELCALSAKCVLPAGATALALTVGFGAGGALIST